MKLWQVPLLCGLFLTHPALGRLGESPGEIAKRYGEPVRTDSAAPRLTIGHYEFNDFNITVFFLDGKSAVESYTPSSAFHPLKEEEIQTLLIANSDGGQWIFEKERSTGSEKFWTREDRKATAKVFAFQLTVTSAEYAAYDAEKDKAERANRAKGMKGF